MSKEDTTQFTVHTAPEETRRQPQENTEEYGDCILAQFATMEEESPFVPRSRLQRTPVITSTPVVRTGRESPERFNLGGHISPVHETREMVPSTGGTEQRYEVFQQTANTRGERTLRELRGHLERLQKECAAEAEKRRLLEEQRQLEGELEFDCEREAQVEFQRRQSQIACNIEKQRREAEQMEAELATLQEQQQMQQRLCELEQQRNQLRASLQPTANRTTPSHCPTPSLEIRSTTTPYHNPRISLSLPTTNPTHIPATSTIETAYRRQTGKLPAERMDAIEFNQALKRLDKAMATSKGHVFKGTTDFQKYEDWVAAWMSCSWRQI